jgi:hypothetical protein
MEVGREPRKRRTHPFVDNVPKRPRSPYERSRATHPHGNRRLEPAAAVARRQGHRCRRHRFGRCGIVSMGIASEAALMDPRQRPPSEGCHNEADRGRGHDRDENEGHFCEGLGGHRASPRWWHVATRARLWDRVDGLNSVGIRSRSRSRIPHTALDVGRIGQMRAGAPAQRVSRSPRSWNPVSGVQCACIRIGRRGLGLAPWSMHWNHRPDGRIASGARSVVPRRPTHGLTVRRSTSTK